MDAIIALLTGLLGLIPSLTGSAALDNVITALVSALPTIIKTFEAALPLFQNVIAALKSHSDITSDQWASVHALSEQAKAAFETEAAGFDADGNVINAGS